MTVSAQVAATEPAQAPRPPRVRCRRIAAEDRAALAALLNRGFPERSAEAWTAALVQVRAHSEAQGHPHDGYVLDAEGELVGVLLTIFGPAGSGRCNLSSWFVDERFRHYATLLVGTATRDRAITYVNISSRRHTRPIIEAQGFRRYADGVFLAAPLLARGPGRGVRTVTGALPAGIEAAPEHRSLMEAHAAMGCLAVWCIAEGRAHPFVFVRRLLAGRVPVAQVAYSAGPAELARFARPLGRSLARHGLVLMLVDAEARLPGVLGRYLPGRMPKYAKGPHVPQLGDLSFTECALFGV